MTPSGSLESGARFGLSPVGLPEANLSSSGSDTERRQMPGLATKGSVFAWTGTPTMPLLLARSTVTGTLSDTVNFRTNTATGGTSVDVPVWAAGAIIQFYTRTTAVGTSTYFLYTVTTPIAAVSTPILRFEGALIVSSTGVEFYQQVIMPFFDEPVMTVAYETDGNGTASYGVNLLGFIRNV